MIINEFILLVICVVIVVLHLILKENKQPEQQKERKPEVRYDYKIYYTDVSFNNESSSMLSGIKCELKEWPGVYTSLTEAREAINQISEKCPKFNFYIAKDRYVV